MPLYNHSILISRSKSHLRGMFCRKLNMPSSSQMSSWLLFHKLLAKWHLNKRFKLFPPYQPQFWICTGMACSPKHWRILLVLILFINSVVIQLYLTLAWSSVRFDVSDWVFISKSFFVYSILGLFFFG